MFECENISVHFLSVYLHTQYVCKRVSSVS